MAKGIFLGFSYRSKAYRVFNTRALAVEESIHVKFKKLSDLEDNFLYMQMESSVTPNEREIKKI